MNFPDQITFKSDKNVMKLVPGTETTNSSKDRIATYKYTKSETKKGLEIPMQISYIERLLNDGLATAKEAKK